LEIFATACAWIAVQDVLKMFSFIGVALISGKFTGYTDETAYKKPPLPHRLGSIYFQTMLYPK
jgi:hypothetical protein